LGESGIDADLDAWLADGEPPAYFGFGSMPVTDPSAALGMICQVTDRLGLRALVSAGWSRMTGGSDDSTRVRVVAALNHDVVMARCRLAVHHGGAGTTAASVSAGIPTVVCSVFADQPFWGVRLEGLGAGAHLRFSKLSSSLLEEGLRRALRAEVGARANELGAALRLETDAANRAAEMVEKVSANGR
ncbi:MAG: glycosyltransferase, partial [Chloroflexota bacterium]